MIEKIVEEFKGCSEVEAIALGGSRGSGKGDSGEQGGRPGVHSGGCHKPPL